MLLGTLPLQRHIRLDHGRSVFLDPEALDEWACTPGLLAPVLLDHDPDRLVGWCDKVKFNRRQGTALIYGDLDPGQPDARAVARLVRSRTRDGLSPDVQVSRGEKWFPAIGRWREGNLVAFPEVSVVWEPKIEGARWLGV